jgi:hypothetical protein
VESAGCLERLVDTGLVPSPDQYVNIVVWTSEPTDPQVDGPTAEEPVLQSGVIQGAGGAFDHQQSPVILSRLLRHG